MTFSGASSTNRNGKAGYIFVKRNGSYELTFIDPDQAKDKSILYTWMMDLAKDDELELYAYNAVGLGVLTAASMFTFIFTGELIHIVN